MALSLLLRRWGGVTAAMTRSFICGVMADGRLQSKYESETDDEVNEGADVADRDVS